MKPRHNRLDGFRGDYEFIVANEYVGRPYVPEGNRSGINLDIRVDLATENHDRVIEIFGPILDNDQVWACKRCRGIFGDDARLLLNNDLILQSIEVTPAFAIEIFPLLADNLWRSMCLRWPNILLPETPGELHTVLLDLVYDRGPLNKHLHNIDGHIRRKNWLLVAENIGEMQQRHKDEKVRERRKMESEYLLAALGDTPSA